MRIKEKWMNTPDNSIPNVWRAMGNIRAQRGKKARRA